MPKLEILTPGELEAKEVPGSTFALEPIFYGSGREPATTAVLKVSDDKGRLVKLYALKMNGSNLTLSLQDRTAPVKPLFERDKRDKQRKGDAPK